MTSCVRTVAQSVLAPIICHFPTSRPYLSLWLDDGYNNAICHLFFFASFSWGVFRSRYIYSWSPILANYSNPINVLKTFRRAIVVCNLLFYWLVSLPLTLLLSVLFVDNLQVCTPKAVCSFVWLCVQHSHRGCICTDVRFDFQSPCPLFILVFFFFSLSYSGFSNRRGSLLPYFPS